MATTQQPVNIFNSLLPDKGPSSFQVMAVIALFPIGGFLLAVAGLSLTATVIGLVVSTPLLIIFSPVLIPAATTIGLAVMGFLTAAAFGLAALSSFSWILNYLRGKRATLPEHLDYAQRRMQEAAGYMEQKAKDMSTQ
ncbi:PREDICTED: oleosin 21.2 kDa-like [Nelumbo nucifera]|uniref:Oleosin n=2 Tax=Nelumbo nucifera TaxID=4432 RepID=A0A1U7ZQW7_NELNU|nr:PREDICTED: oleosin 21.2 kDa-like [Nelumbo nucifera]DAD34488.1 TPA_asm: hypothetical protein HUJ06_005128 [Nelumbo nucifera]